MSEPKIDIKGILEILPHRYPFVLIDRVLELEPEVRVLTQKNVTFNEPFFSGHFPDHPVMPGVLIVEAMAQSAAVLASQTLEKTEGQRVYYFVGIDNCRFKKLVVPGDVLKIEVKQNRVSRGIGKYSAEAAVDGKVVACADLMCTARDV